MNEIDNLNRRIKQLEDIINIGRQEKDFDIFYQRFIMSNLLDNLPLERLSNLYNESWYADYWKAAGRARESTKFAPYEKKIFKQIINKVKQEENPIKIQYLALALILFDKLDLIRPLINQNLWPQKLRDDFNLFESWSKLTVPAKPDGYFTIMNSDRTAKIKEMIKSKYGHLIEKYANFVVNEETCPPVPIEDYKIYFCWLQGKNSMPPVIKCCYDSLLKTAGGGMDICFIDAGNYSDYIDLPKYIVDKFNTKKIGPAHFSDILRVNLLESYGGLWLDATILVTEPLNKHENFWKLPYFSQKFPGWNKGSSFIQGAAILHNPLYAFLKEFYEAYFQDFNEVIVYFLLDIITEFAREGIPFVNKIMLDLPENNPDVLCLSKHLNDPYDEYPFEKILKNNFLHKLSYRTPLNLQNKNSVFGEIQRRYN